jgi:hypothetical protein
VGPIAHSSAVRQARGESSLSPKVGVSMSGSRAVAWDEKQASRRHAAVVTFVLTS